MFLFVFIIKRFVKLQSFLPIFPFLPLIPCYRNKQNVLSDELQLVSFISVARNCKRLFLGILCDGTHCGVKSF